MPLYHFSEDANIRVFEPHVAPTSRESEPLVWAIDDWHAPMYYLPRDCPRACFWPGPRTTAEDCERWFGGIDARMVVAVETAWLPAIRSAALYRYTVPDASFRLNDATAGHWVSQQAVRPLSVEPVGDLLRAITDARVELRITPRLVDMWKLVIESTLEFSGTRLRNARGWLELFGEGSGR